MEYRILGPLEVVDGDRSVRLGTAKQQALLAVLVLHANKFVARERLIDELWGESRPATAEKAVQVYVSHLRKLLAHNGDQAISTRPRGYVLSIDGESVDAASFERLARDARERAAGGDAEHAASLFREGLELWRGPALAGLTFESVARIEVERLEEERIAVLMDRIDCDLSLGRHEQLVGELEGMVAEHPLRERFRSQLMLALYRSGRQADALRVYREGRETLVEQLGLEPSEPLQRLERAILVHDPVLEAPAGRLARPRVPTAAEKAALPAARRRRPRRLVAAVALVLAAVAVATTVFLRAEEPVAKLLSPNSVGFIDADSGRVTRSFAVGREPSSLALANGSLWVANYRDQTVTRIDLESGRTTTIPVRGHPTGITSYQSMVWVWTLEELLVAIDPRFDSAGVPVLLRVGGRPLYVRTRSPGRVVAGAHFLWMTAPAATVLRVDPTNPERRSSIVLDTGALGPIAYYRGEVWVAGSGAVVPVAASTGIPRTEITVGGVRDLAFGDDSLWVLSGGGGISHALRRVDTSSGLVQAEIAVGVRPVAVAFAAGSVWVASQEGREWRVYRVEAADNRLVDRIPVGSIPTAIAADRSGIWVAVK